MPVHGLSATSVYFMWPLANSPERPGRYSMECCPYLDRLIDADFSQPFDPDLDFHLLICRECGETWEVIQEIRTVFPDRETFERVGREIEEKRRQIEAMIPKILAALPPPSPGRRKPRGWSFLEWGPWRGTAAVVRKRRPPK
jgi:hypothetical protein